MRAEVILFDSAHSCYFAVTAQNTVVFSLESPGTVRIGDVLEGEVELYGIQKLENATRSEEIQVKIRELHRLGRPFLFTD